MRAADYKHYGCENDRKVTAKSQKHEKAHKRRGVKILSAVAAVTAAVAMLIVPTTTLAPDVDAYEDVRTVSLSLGDLSDFSGIITENCVEPTTEPITRATVQTTASEAEQTTEKSTTAAKTESTTEAAKTSTSADTTAETSQTSSASSAASSSSAEPSESDYYYTQESYTEQSSEDDDEDCTYSQSSSSSSSSSGAALVSISNPDYSYSPQAVTLSSYDREKLERLVMGEAGSMGYTGCALVAQAIRDSMNRSNTTSIDRIISEYQYYGSTANEPNQDVKDAVAFIFDQNGIAVQHRIICFYVGTSSWHETQNYITSCGSVRFFDLWY